MKPDVGTVLEVVGGKLLLEVAPAVGPGYQRQSVALTGILLTMVKEEWERSASRRVEENAALRALFGRAASVVTDPELRRRLGEAAASADASFQISLLEQANAALRTLLIELHAHVESLESPAARALDDEIWSELVASTERRRFGLAPF
ncbi:MAG TPA: hypothetical protein VMR86_06850 [Myxococcota bacterium]|nr:hypothetical protein [Myxococcota bacterium]